MNHKIYKFWTKNNDRLWLNTSNKILRKNNKILKYYNVNYYFSLQS